LAVILEEAGIEHGVDLTVDVMRQILKSFGEDHWPDDVVKAMVEQAGSKARTTSLDVIDADDEAVTEIPVLDGRTLLRALTADTQAYDVDVEDIPTTMFEDVNMMNRNLNDSSSRSVHQFDDDGSVEGKRPPPSLHRVYTADSIDFTADSYVSFSWTILVWFTILTTFFR